MYNVEKYLDESLRSVENQTYGNLEIICVNDGSTDGSAEILREHKSKDRRVKVIEQENGGVSAARNTGMDAATGEWLYFVDSDDLILPYTVEKAVESAEKYDADMVNFEHTKFDDGKSIDLNSYPYKKSGIQLLEIKGRENPFKFYNMREVNVWQNLYRRSFLTEHNIKFKTGVICEDVLFTWKCQLYAKKMVKDKNRYYFYRSDRKGSIMNSDFKKIEKRLESFFAMIDEFISMRPEFDFERIDEQFIEMMLVLFYEPIYYGLEKAPEQKDYAARALSVMEDQYINVYKATPNYEQSEKIGNLKKLLG